MNVILKQALVFCETVFELAEQFQKDVSILAVDKGGHLIALLRTDRAAFVSIEAARRKAVASASMGMPTSALLHMFEKDPLVVTALTASGEMLIVPGGFPLIVGGNCVGGLGIAGGHYSEDQMLGERAIAKIASAA